MDAAEYLLGIVRAQKAGLARGAWSACSAHRLVLRAAMEQARADDHPVLIESTVNQVNQYGGYTGMQPADFAAAVGRIADAARLPRGHIILGADHLGPLPWRSRPAATSIEEARTLAVESVRAGYTKIHLDASMPLGGDPLDAHGGIAPELAAAREAELAEAAERAFAEVQRETPRAPLPVYVIGTEVPAPGGAAGSGGDGAGVRPTPVAELERTVEACREAFSRRGLRGAWERVVAVVAQPGLEFGDRHVDPYDRNRARGLCRFARALPGMVLEGHSTDYQAPAALRALVEDGVAVLKVGPALTFALREALFGLEMIEREMLDGSGIPLSDLAETVDRAMRDNPTFWRSHLAGDERALRLARRYGLSDRSRYYWSVPAVEAAVARLLVNLSSVQPPAGLISQHLPSLRRPIAAGELPWDPEGAAVEAVKDALRPYASAVKELPG